MTHYHYNPPPIVNVHVDTTQQALAQMAGLDKTGLARLAGTYTAKAAGLAGSLTLWRVSTVASLAIGCFAYLVAGASRNRNTEGLSVMVCIGAGLCFIVSACMWGSVSSQISNANLWHSYCVQMINTPV